MDIVQLPVISAKSSIRTALRSLLQAQRSGLVAKLEGGNVVLELHDLLSAGGDPDGPISALAPSRGTGTINFNPMHDHQATERILDEQDSVFAVLDIKKSQARVVTRHEGIGADLGGSPDYYVCTGPRGHPYEEMPLNGHCHDDGYLVVRAVV